MSVQNSDKFQLLKTDAETRARLGRVHTAHGSFDTPMFMPVATIGALKGVRTDEVKELGAQILLANTYHLYLRPGHQEIKALGGLHKFMAWDGPILTDSGGFQVFSLAQLAKVKEEGVAFQSHLDGSKHLLTPELVVEIQEALGSDILMPLDECLPYPSEKAAVAKSIQLTTRWEGRCLQAKSRQDNQLFAIIQGGMFKDLRLESARMLTELEVKNERISNTPIQFDAFAIGGVSVGEPMELAYDIAGYTTEILPENKPRYLMGVGMPEDILISIYHGIDMFDCVIPTRNARNGMLFTDQGPINIRNSQYKDDPQALDASCACYSCQNFSRAYLRHLSMNREILSAVLGSIHNLHYYLSLLDRARQAIQENRYLAFLRERLSAYGLKPYV